MSMHFSSIVNKLLVIKKLSLIILKIVNNFTHDLYSLGRHASKIQSPSFLFYSSEVKFENIFDCYLKGPNRIIRMYKKSDIMS